MSTAFFVRTPGNYGSVKVTGSKYSLEARRICATFTVITITTTITNKYHSLMKTLRFLTVLAFAGSAFAGVDSYDRCQTNSARAGAHHAPCARLKDAGTPGTYHYSNLFRNAVTVVNDTPCFMTFFVYFSDQPNSSDINGMIRHNAHIQPMVVPPYQTRYFEQRRSHYVIGTRHGSWAIDSTKGRLVSNSGNAE